MWLEYMRYRLRLRAEQNCLDLAQSAALRSLRHSPRCRGWRVLPAPDDPSLSVLEIDWDPGESLTPFRASEEFAELHAALGEQVRALEEADYRANTRLLRQIIGGPEALFRLAEDIVAAVMRAPELSWRFHSLDGSRRGRLGLWLLQVLGGPDLFSSSFPDASASDGPLAGDMLDLEERERLLEIAESVLPSEADDGSRCVIGTLRAHLPLYPLPPSRLEAPRLEAGDVTSPACMLTSEVDAAGEESVACELALYTELRQAELEEDPTASGTRVWAGRAPVKVAGQ